jgi:hypothetical protein
MNWKKLMHRHQWTLTRTYINSKDTYAHEHFICDCGKQKHIKHYWDKKPIVRIYKLVNQK